MASFYEDTLFCADKDSDCRLTALALQRLPEGCDAVLEIGCGTGRQTLDLAAHWPQTRFCGVDISSCNIAAANAAIARAQLADRVAVVQADYMTFDGGPFDCILADSALHFFDAPPEAIFARIAAQLRPGGILLINATYRCPSNTLVRAVRTGYRLLPPGLVDRLAFFAAKRVFRGRFTDAALQSRLAYLRILPTFYMHPGLLRRLETRCGLVCAHEEVEPFIFGKSRHKKYVFTKRPA